MKPIDPTMQTGVYQIRNRVTGDIYIGSTARNFRVRWAQHRNALARNKGSRHLNRAWFKYGPDQFEFSVLIVCAPENVLMFEQRAIDALKPAYNLSPTAGNTTGIACSPEKAKKISTAHKGKASPKARVFTIDGITESYVAHAARLGVVTAELAKSRVKKGWDMEIALKTPKQTQGLWAKTDSGRATISAAKKGKPSNITPEALAARNAKIAAANKVRVITDAHRENSRRAQLKRFNPQFESP